MYDIIYPFYKDFKYLAKSLNFISKQSLLPNNLIFIDDGNKIKHLKKLVLSCMNTDINLIFIENKKNLGTNKSINLGLEKLSSPFFLYLCS